MNKYFFLSLLIIIYINTWFQNNKFKSCCIKEYGKPKYILYRYGGIDDLKPFLCYWKIVLVYEDFILTDYRGDKTKITKNAKIEKINYLNFFDWTCRAYNIEYGEGSSILFTIPLLYINKCKEIEEFFTNGLQN